MPSEKTPSPTYQCSANWRIPYSIRTGSYSIPYLQKNASIIPENNIQFENTGTVERVVLKAVTSCARTLLSVWFHNHGHRINARARNDASTSGCPPFHRK